MARGGYRPGAGRPKGSGKKPSAVEPSIEAAAKLKGVTPLEYMLEVMRDVSADPLRRDRMAVAAAPFVHVRQADGKGKKEERQEAAEQASAGRFGASEAPRLVVNNT